MLKFLCSPDVMNAKVFVTQRTPEHSSWHLAADAGGGKACIEKRAHDYLALLFGQVRSHHRIFDRLHDGMGESIPCDRMG